MRRGPINKRRILVNPKGRRQTVIGRKHIGNQGLKVVFTLLLVKKLFLEQKIHNS